MEGNSVLKPKKIGTKKDCYSIIQEIAVARDKVCQKPECSRRAEAGHHLWKRDRFATAFLPEAILGLCTQHHTGWAHNKPEEFKKFMVARMGEEYYELRRLSNTVVKNLDYNEIYKGLVCVLGAWKQGT